jgi:hypothetical protein
LVVADTLQVFAFDFCAVRGTTLFKAHLNLSDEVNRNIIGSEIEGGVFLDRLQLHSVLLIQTQHRCYTAVMLGGSKALISGHPKYCPEPTLVGIAGSTWGGSMLKRRFVGRGMHLEFCHPEYPTPIVTSRVQEIRECPEPTPDQPGQRIVERVDSDN